MTTAAAPRIRVLLVDDHTVVRQALAALVRGAPDLDVVGEAGDGVTALRVFREVRPDVTLMDLRLPSLDGVAAISLLRGEHPDGKFLVLTTFDGDEDIHRALLAGAAGYLLKDVTAEVLLQAIRDVHRGRQVLPAEIAERALRRRYGAELTAREVDVLRHITEGSSNKEIARSLSVTEGTVKWYVNRLLVKLGVSSRTEAAMEALKRGIVVRPPR